MSPPHTSLPDRTHPGPVRLAVGDLSRSLEWYQSVLGLERLDEGGADEDGPDEDGADLPHVTLGVGADHRPLVHLEEHPDIRPVRPRSRLGLFHFAILLPDRSELGRFVKHLRERGLRAGSADHAVSEALYLQDPDGLGIEVYSDRPREMWYFRGDELVMTTEPLDLDDVVRSADGGPWRTIPAGTVMGHVHLHVGDLVRAEAFYHETLGFDRMVWSYPGALFLSAGGYHHHLGLNTWAGDSPPPSERDARLIEWELRIPAPSDATALVDRLAEAGHDVERPDASGDDAHVASAWARVKDPWGTVVRIRP